MQYGSALNLKHRVQNKERKWGPVIEESGQIERRKRRAIEMKSDVAILTVYIFSISAYLI